MAGCPNPRRTERCRSAPRRSNEGAGGEHAEGASHNGIDLVDPSEVYCPCCGLPAPPQPLCAHCSWPLGIPWSEETAYELGHNGHGGSCVSCGAVQMPCTMCLGCGAPVEPADGSFFYYFGWQDGPRPTNPGAWALLDIFVSLQQQASAPEAAAPAIAAPLVDLAAVGPLPADADDHESATESTISA